MVFNEAQALAYGDFGGLLHWIAVYTAADSGERNGADSVRERQLEAPPIAGGKQLGLAAPASLPHGADGVNDVFCRQPIAAGELGVSGRAAAERAALGEELGSRGAVDRAVHAAAAEQRVVRGVDDGVHGEPRDIGFDGSQPS